MILSICFLAFSVALLLQALVSRTGQNSAHIVTQHERYISIMAAVVVSLIPLCPSLFSFGFHVGGLLGEARGENYPEGWFAISLVCALFATIVAATLVAISVYKNPSYLAKQVSIPAEEDDDERIFTGYVTTKDMRSRSKRRRVLKPEEPYTYYGKPMRQYATLGYC